ncbi:hypothetical protein HDU97_001728 [Phlyctochytrium planicorne]|nr:hypothetical protein HDU97_001728 [Phlyctochytrium planicorne]
MVDSSMNSERVVMQNVHENFMLCGMKFYLQKKELTRHFGPPSLEFVKGCLLEVIVYGYLLIRSKVRSAVGKELHASFLLSFVEVQWLALKAFRAAFLPKRGSMMDIIGFLDERLKDPKFTSMNQRVKNITSNLLLSPPKY